MNKLTLEARSVYLEKQNLQLIEINKINEATISFYKELLNRTIESYAAEISQNKDVDNE